MVKYSCSGHRERDAGAMLVHAVKAARIVLALKVPGVAI
jgi:hypothetical protein